jgi:peptidylprolyl isomerase
MKWVDAIEKGEPPENPTSIVKASISADKVPPPPAMAQRAMPALADIPLPTP